MADEIKNIKDVADSDKLAGDLETGKKVTLFRCAGTGLFFPSDYLENWGIKYGFSLGRDPVSECLETMWSVGVVMPKDFKSEEQLMYPVRQGNHQVDAFVMTKAAADNIKRTGQMAILGIDDPFMIKRAKIIRNKQLKNKNRLLQTYLNVNGVRNNA